ncbi:MAG TPA: hypothetical protein ENK98_01090 [Epsilonproteobacteria bacterium]|nr:hypothetical protein [Campylobacterota bacterium]
MEPKPTPEPIKPTVDPTPAPVVEPKPTPEPIKPTVDPTPAPVVEPKPEPEVELESTSEENCAIGNAMQQGQVKDMHSGRGIKDVSVTVNGCSTKTDAGGFYILDNIAEDERAALIIKANKAYLQSTVVAIKEYAGDDTLSPNFTEYKISKYTSRWSYFSQKGISNAIGNISKDTIYTDKQGIEYNGLVYGGWTFKSTMNDSGRDAFIGLYEGRNTDGNIVPFVSYGFFSLELKKVNNQLLNVSGSITLKLKNIRETTKETIALWYYDYKQGIRIEEGSAKRNNDGSYIATITHAGTWSLNKALEKPPGIYKGRIVDVDGMPMADVRLEAVGKNWISKDLTTDENGNFEIKVIPDSNFKLKAYNYKDKYAAEYRQEIKGIPSGIISEN